MWCKGHAALMLGGGNGSIPFMDFLSYDVMMHKCGDGGNGSHVTLRML